MTADSTTKGENMTEYKPGTVAEVRPTNSDSWTRAIRHRNGEWASAQFGHFLDDEVSDIRPLVVLDLTVNPQYTSNLIRKFTRDYGGGAILNCIADQIDEQTKSPRIPEPGPWGVVKARLAATDHPQKWVHMHKGWTNQYGHYTPWADLVDPTLIREGVK